MDNMAYLQQIAGTDNTIDANAKKSGGFLSKVLNIWTALIAGGLIIIMIIVGVVAGMMNKVDTKDQDLMQQSYFMAFHMLENVYSRGYTENIKNSDIRNMSESFSSALKEISLKENEFLLDRYGIEIDDYQEEPVSTDEKEKIDELCATLDSGRLNGIFDRTWLREMTLQIAIIRSYQSEIAARTKDEEIKEFSERIESNLDNIYNQFHDFKSPGI